MKVKTLFIMIVLFFSFWAFAQDQVDCSPVNLKDEFGPIRDQGNGGYCYAIAVADLIQFKTHRSVSYLDLALQAHLLTEERTNNLDDLDGGLEADALKAAKKFGTCSTDKFPDDENSYDSIKRAYVALRKPHFCPAMPAGLNQNMYDLLSLGAGYKKNSVKVLLDKACGLREKTLDPYKIVSFNISSALRGVDEALSKKEASVIGTNEVPPLDGHAMIVVGREMDKKTRQCRYIVRNSWGNCTTYSRKMMARLKAKSIGCEKGYLYIQRDTLKEMISDSMYLESL